MLLLRTLLYAAIYQYHTLQITPKVRIGDYVFAWQRTSTREEEEEEVEEETLLRRTLCRYGCGIT